MQENTLISAQIWALVKTQLDRDRCVSDTDQKNESPEITREERDTAEIVSTVSSGWHPDSGLIPSHGKQIHLPSHW